MPAANVSQSEASGSSRRRRLTVQQQCLALGPGGPCTTIGDGFAASPVQPAAAWPRTLAPPPLTQALCLWQQPAALSIVCGGWR